MKTDAKKRSLFRKRLLDFLDKSGREHLPWRRKGLGPYEIWVSEVMLQQTQVSRVIGYYIRFLKRFPTVKSLARVSWEEFLPYYAGLGYYSRGRNMLKAARKVVEEHSGVFPTKVEVLEQLPGVGPYTARAIVSFASGLPYLAWDTNLKRVFGRVFRGGKQLLIEKDERDFDAKLGKDARELNAAIMDFGSSICVARPKCEACMLRDICLYYEERGKREAVFKKKKTQSESRKENRQAVVYLHENHRKYYSSEVRRFAPFVLPLGYADRAGIKEYFRKRYDLELAVRPPHAISTLRKQSVILVNAQVLLGEPNFSVFSKTDVLRYNKTKFHIKRG